MGYNKNRYRKPRDKENADPDSNPKDQSIKPRNNHNNHRRRHDSGMAQKNEEVKEKVVHEGLVKEGVYYRYTDIVYFWHPLLNPWQCNALKSLISTDALVHPSHPLYVSTPPPPKDTITISTSLPSGIPLILALFPSKKVRLLFTLTQIEYLLYYISELGLVKCGKEDVKRWKKIVKEENKRKEKREEGERRRLGEMNSVGEGLVLGQGVKIGSQAVVPSVKIDTSGQQTDQMIKSEDVVSNPSEDKIAQETKSKVEVEVLVDAEEEEDEEEEDDEDEDEDDNDIDPTYIPMPSSKSLVFPEEIEDMLEVRFSNVDQLKLAYRNPLKVYKSVKAGTFYDEMSFEEEEVKEDASSAVVKGGDDLQADDPKDKKGSDPKNSKGTSISATVEDEDQDKNVRKTAIVDENGIVKRMIVEKKKGKGYEGIELGPSSKRPSGPASTYHHAEQAYIIACQGGIPPQYVPGHEPTIRPFPNAGRGIFLTIDFEAWELEFGVILEVGWAAAWFEEGKGNDFGNWQEKRDQGHWKVKEYLKYQNSDVPEDHDIYLYGETEIITLETFRTKIKTLIEDVRARVDGGPVYLITHSAHKDILEYGLLDLPYETFHTEMHPEGFVSPAYQTAKGNGKTFILDTSEMIAALTNVTSEEGADEQKSDLSLREMTLTICREAPEPIGGFGNCGNDAWIHLECFLAMVQWNFDIMSSYFNHTLPDDQPEEPDSTPQDPLAAQKAASKDKMEAKAWAEALDAEEAMKNSEVRFPEPHPDVEIDGFGPEGEEVWLEMQEQERS